MRKLIFTANVIALIALVPAILFGYLNTQTNSTETKPTTEVVSKDVTNGQDDGSVLRLVKSF